MYRIYQRSKYMHIRVFKKLHTPISGRGLIRRLELDRQVQAETACTSLIDVLVASLVHIVCVKALQSNEQNYGNKRTYPTYRLD